MSNKVWGYARVSTTEQNEERQTIELLPLLTSSSHLIIEKKVVRNSVIDLNING